MEKNLKVEQRKKIYENVLKKIKLENGLTQFVCHLIESELKIPVNSINIKNFPELTLFIDPEENQFAFLSYGGFDTEEGNRDNKILSRKQIVLGFCIAMCS